MPTLTITTAGESITVPYTTTPTKPSATNTGIPPTTVLTQLGSSGTDLIITADNTVIDGKDIYGDIKIRARNVTIRNSRLRGGRYIPASNTGIVDCNSVLCFNATITNCEIIPDQPSYYRDGIVGHEYTATYNEVAFTNDGFGIFNKPGGVPEANVTVMYNYVHDLTYWDNDPAHSDGTHNDCVQVQGGRNILIAWNTLVCTGVIPAGHGGDSTKPGCPAPHGHGAAIVLQNNTSTPLVNCVVEDNWLDDGNATVTIHDVNATVRRNKFGRNAWPYQNIPGKQQYFIRINNRTAQTITGLDTNVWEDTGLPLVEGRTGGIWYNAGPITTN